MSTNDINNDSKEVGQAVNIFNFIKVLAMITLSIIFVVILGSLSVYCCKVAQSNILPTDANCFPYTSTVPIIQSILINVNDYFINGKYLSQKIHFPYEINSSNSIFDFFRKLRLTSYASGPINYFISLLDGLTAFNFSAYNLLFSLLNYLPESFVLLLGPFITLLFSSILSLVDNFVFAYLWFKNLGWLFKENNNKSGSGKPIWKSISIFEPVHFCISLFLVLLFIILFFVIIISFLPLISLISVISIIFCFLIMLTRTALDSNNIKYNVFNCMKDSLGYNKKVIMVVLSFAIIILTLTYLGPILSIISFFTILLIYFNILPFPIFSPTIPPFLTEIVSDKQASKSCNEIKIKNKISKANNPSLKSDLLQKIGGFLPKFPQIFPSIDVTETYNTKIPAIPYPEIKIGEFDGNLEIPKEVEINFPDIKLPAIPQSVTDTVKVIQDKTIEGLNKINNIINPNTNSNTNSNANANTNINANAIANVNANTNINANANANENVNANVNANANANVNANANANANANINNNQNTISDNKEKNV